jgi:hypothetical protein
LNLELRFFADWSKTRTTDAQRGSSLHSMAEN